MIKFIISPAKLMDLKSIKPYPYFTHPHFITETIELDKIIKILSPDDLSKLMRISPKLGQHVWGIQQEWTPTLPENKSLQAIFSFKGEVYRGINPAEMTDENIQKLQEKGYILSGFYGILKPLDRIMVYRLEMGSKLKVEKYQNLYEFWGDKLTDFINDEMNPNDYLIDLSSHEYFKAINRKKLKPKVINIEFKDFKNGKLKPIMTFFKHARGEMARYIAENNINTLDELKLFSESSYTFDVNLSTEDNLIWTR